jgi:hypothetical protein
MDGTLSTHGLEKLQIQKISVRKPSGRRPLGILGIDDRIIIEWMLKKLGVGHIHWWTLVNTVMNHWAP